MQKKPKVSIIIVHYGNKGKLYGCLESIEKSKPKLAFEIIVVDNDERKTIGRELKRKFPKVGYLKADGNIGYGAGNNRGAKQAKGEFLLILNPDTEVLAGTIDKLANFLRRNKDVAIVAPSLVNKKLEPYQQLGSKELTPLRGIVNLSFLNRLFPENPISRGYWMKDVSVNKLREVDVVPGSALMVRKAVFDKLGGFDENFFLFFEESDFCKRVKEKDLKLYINPNAKVIHYWGKSTPKSEKIKQIFMKSRFYYFKKHYGLFPAYLVELFARFSKWHALLIAIIALAAFLRLYRIEENLVFHGELGHNYLAIKDFIQKRQLPLLGPPTSHPWLSFGPLYYWLFGPLLALASYNPVFGAYFMVFISILIIVLNFVVWDKLFNKEVAVISSYLMAISPLWLHLTREARFFYIAPLFFYPFFFFLIKSFKGQMSNLFWVGLFLGVMLNFHLTPITFLPAVFTLLYIYRKKVKSTDILRAFGGFLLPNIPFLLYNLLHSFNMLVKFTLWLPYRLIGFIGLYPKNTTSIEVVKLNLASLFRFISSSFTAQQNTLSIIFLFGIVLYALYKAARGVSRKNLLWISIVLIFVWGYLGIFIHGDPPSHYYLPLYPLPVLFAATGLERLSKVKKGYLAIALLVTLTFVNFRYFFSEKWFYKPDNKIVDPLIPYSLQLQVAETIIEDSGGEDFTLSRVGPFDYYEGDYAQNYRYLLWWMDNEPVEDADLSYTVYEDVSKLPDSEARDIFWIDKIAILKEER